MSLAHWQLPPDPADGPAISRSPEEIAAHRMAAALNYGGAAIAGWLVFYGWPFEFAFIATAIAPLLGIALIQNSGGYIQFAGDQRHSGLLFMFGLVPFGLTLATDKQRLIEVVDVIPALVFMLVVTAAITAIFPALRRNFLWLGGTAVLAGFYGFGVLSFINIHGDTAAPDRLRTTVTDISAPSKYGRNKLFYSVRVPEFEMLKISRSDFMALGIGSPICVTVHPGLLGMRWVETSRCA